ncbi:hypothetical protein Fmac_028731 [Flemingia macrophylla]|uniref:Gag-like protein n=1 Tax=Flemingia macrophylla TaxID=520843 RepID=A0ABD1L8B4_9FABA
MDTILASVLLCSNLEWMNILRLKLQTPIADHHNGRDKALDREDGSQLLAQTTTAAETRHLIKKMVPNSYQFSEINDAIVIKGVHNVAIDTSAETRKLEVKLDALVKLVTQLAANQKPAFFTIVCGIRSSNDHHTSEFSARNDAIVIRGVHDVAINTSAETRKVEVKLDAFVNLVTQLAANHKPAFVARICGIRSSNDHLTSVWPSSPYPRVDELPEAYAKAGSKVDALVNLVTELVANQKPASFVRVCDICFSNDHHTSVCPSSQKSKVDEHPDAYVQFSARNDAIIIKGAHDVAIDTSVETRKLEGKLDALVKLVTLLAVNQKPASIARVYVIRSSNNNHTSVSPSSKQSGVDKLPEAYDANTYRRPPQRRETRHLIEKDGSQLLAVQ